MNRRDAILGTIAAVAAWLFGWKPNQQNWRHPLPHEELQLRPRKVRALWVPAKGKSQFGTRIVKIKITVNKKKEFVKIFPPNLYW